MLETQEGALRLLNCLKCSAQAELFARESKKILTEYGSEVKREFQECLVTSNIIHDVIKIPRTTKQEIELLCKNKGEIKGTKRFLELVFRYDKYVFYDFLELVINSCQTSLFKKLIFAIQQKTSFFNNILPASQTSISQSSEIDQILSSDSQSVQLSNAKNIDGQLHTQKESDNCHFSSNPTSVYFDKREIEKLRNIRKRVLEMYGSIEEFDRQFMQQRSSHVDYREGIESDIIPESFSF